MILQEKAYQLLAEWENIKHTHFNYQQNEIQEVIYVEYEKEKIQELANYISSLLLNISIQYEQLEVAIGRMEKELNEFEETFILSFLKTK